MVAFCRPPPPPPPPRDFWRPNARRLRVPPPMPPLLRPLLRMLPERRLPERRLLAASPLPWSSEKRTAARLRRMLAERTLLPPPPPPPRLVRPLPLSPLSPRSLLLRIHGQAAVRGAQRRRLRGCPTRCRHPQPWVRAGLLGASSGPPPPLAGCLLATAATAGSQALLVAAAWAAASSQLSVSEETSSDKIPKTQVISCSVLASRTVFFVCNAVL
jgi:hypothetical protein